MLSRTEKNKDKRKKIDKEKNKEKRERRTKIIFKILLVLAIVLISMYITLRYIGNLGLFIKESAVINNKVTDSFHGIKIVQFTDLHYGTTVDTKRLEEIKNKINNLNPDIIVFTGDLVDRHYSITKKESEEVKTLLTEMKATLGKYAVQGNHDKNNFDNIMKDTDFIVLDNSYDLIYKDDNNPILITGIGSSTLNNTDIDKAFYYFTDEASNKEIFTIAIMHEPDNIDEMLEKYNVDLDKLNYRYFLQLMGLVIAFDLSIVITIIGFVHALWLKLLLSFILVIIIVFISFNILGKYFKKKGLTKDE